MTEALTIPVTMTSEAAARVAELGMHTELDQMLDKARQVVPGIERLQVILEPAYDTGDEPYLTIEALLDPAAYTTADAARRAWGRWKIDTIPTQVGRHITLRLVPSPRHAG